MSMCHRRRSADSISGPGDIVCGNIKVKTEKEKFSALLYIRTVNGMPPYEAQRRGKFENMTPVFPDSRINLETPNAPVSMRIMNLVSPIGRGQRGMIVSPPKTGKTTLLKQVAKAIPYQLSGHADDHSSDR